MSDLDTQSSEIHLKIGQYLRKYALLYSKCAKDLDSNVNPEDMNKELIRMARYIHYIYILFFYLILKFFY